MPTYLRQFYFKKLLDVKQEEKKRAEESRNKNKPKVSKPAINPRFKR
tara:strand:- start:716 stop:856 length:141 start_codon:yes stop_codon:yes gene_type:complete